MDKLIQTILVVDDDKATRQLLCSILGEYNILEAQSGKEALEMAGDDEHKPDLILLDVVMPDMKGHDVCRILKTDLKTQNIPVLFLTIADNPDLETHGLSIGAVDYIKKPIYANILLARVKSQLELKSYRDDLQGQVNTHKKRVENLNKEIIDTQQTLIFILGNTIETHSSETAQHVQRISKYTCLLANKMGLAPGECQILEIASPLHDVGKIGIPGAILSKPGALTPEERNVINMHAEIGYNMFKRTTSSHPILKAAAIIAHQHHERWNGDGYPQGLKGEEIHIFGRIVAIADVFDALATKKCYKTPWPEEKIIEEFKHQRGKQFDPVLIDFFLADIDDFYAILEMYPD